MEDIKECSQSEASSNGGNETQATEGAQPEEHLQPPVSTDPMIAMTVSSAAAGGAGVRPISPCRKEKSAMGRIFHPPKLERKHSSGDLHSRLKTRKMLGVGETDNGDIHRSKLDTKHPKGAKGKSPWITLNGQDLADSQLIIQFLTKKFGVRIDEKFSPEQLGLATSVRVMLEEHFNWGMAQWRFVYGEDETLTKVLNLPPVWLVRLVVGRNVKSTCKAQGLGRHSKEDMTALTSADLRAVSAVLGNKKFILGDEPCIDDCGIFGELAQVVWGLPGTPYEKLVEEDLQNIKAYCLRMKERFWSDWDQCLAPSK